MSPMIQGVSVTEACAKALVLLGSGQAIPLGEFDPRVPRTLAKNELAVIDEKAGVLKISAAGVELLKAYKAKNGTPAPVHETKPAPRETKATKGDARPRAGKTAKRPYKRRVESPPPTGVVDFDALRAQIVAHYEADLAACDRMREIAARVRTA